jgi:1-acyl-sn-glycerol-3-phosphate acyltransferase
MWRALVRFTRAVQRLGALGWIVVTSSAAFVIVPAHRRTLAARARWLQHTCRRGLRALKVTATTTGRCPRGTIVTANHLGYLDILVLAATTPVVFVAKREVRAWPVFGWFARMSGTRFIDREKRSDVVRVASELEPALAAGVSVVLFLEGTSTDGSAVRPFKSSLLEPAARRGWPVVPAALAYRVPAGHSAADEVCWWADMTLGPHLWNLAALPFIDARLAWGEPIRGEDRKQLAAALHVACVELLELEHGHLARNGSPADRMPSQLGNSLREGAAQEAGI